MVRGAASGLARRGVRSSGKTARSGVGREGGGPDLAPQREEVQLVGHSVLRTCHNDNVTLSDLCREVLGVDVASVHRCLATHEQQLKRGGGAGGERARECG